MFDLFRSRDKVVRYMLGGVLLIVAASMITYLIPSYNNGGLVNNSPVIADIGGQKITAQWAELKFDSLTRNSQIPAEMVDIYFPQFIESMVVQRAAVYEAQRMGLAVTDDEVI